MLLPDGTSNDCEVVVIAPGDDLWDAAGTWARWRASSALLILGDRTQPLCARTFHWAAVDACGEVRGVAVQFFGFADPVVSVAAESGSVATALLNASYAKGGVLAVAKEQSLLGFWSDLAWVTDTWLVAPCAIDEGAEGMVEAISDVGALGAFYHSVGVRFWCEEMTQFGHSFVIYHDSEIICAGSVNFVMDGIGYAQIGAVVTHPDYRGKSNASMILRAIRSSLARSGIPWSGLFADAAHNWLSAFYGRRGFLRAGACCFAPVPNRS